MIRLDNIHHDDTRFLFLLQRFSFFFYRVAERAFVLIQIYIFKKIWCHFSKKKTIIGKRNRWSPIITIKLTAPIFIYGYTVIIAHFTLASMEIFTALVFEFSMKSFFLLQFDRRVIMWIHCRTDSVAFPSAEKWFSFFSYNSKKVD